ncbi:MAG: deoxyhypusine synthase family protein, partial [Candidatus Altiarchaeota archaeon]|nr:deoxyhypusine synthase family protein [Candidatus Altiarchaeota archaeon]
MEFIGELKWKPGEGVSDLVESFKATGFQSTELFKASSVMYKMWN